MSTAPAPFNVAGDTNHAINFAVCGDDLVGSAGQAVYDARTVVNLATGAATTLHYVYVPDNAVKSTAVWRLTFDPSTETMVADPNGGAMATAMTPLADVRTLKPNGMALGPDGNLYVTDLVDPNVRRDHQPERRPAHPDDHDRRGDRRRPGRQRHPGLHRQPALRLRQPGRPVLRHHPVPAGRWPVRHGLGARADRRLRRRHRDGRGDTTSSTSPTRPGGANATVYRYDASHDVYVAFAPGTYPPDAFGVVHCTLCTFGPQAQAYVTGGTLPAQDTPNGTVTCALTCQRPWDNGAHPTTAAGFSFAFGLGMDPSGNLAITEDPSAGARSGRGTMWIVPFLP